jgi:site-specific DNA-cytosine methylase
MKALGVHVFAGGFSKGVKKIMPVEAQLETHGFGLETAEQVFGVPTHNSPAAEWPRIEADMVFGNPRCTGFSNLTGGCDPSSHGPWAHQCQDIHDLCNYSVGHYDFVIWESVQQAYTTGKPLIDHLVKEHFASAHYRIAHLFLNAASFGNPQQRKRYFFVAYRDCFKFNVAAPDVDPFYQVVYDSIWQYKDRQVNMIRNPTGKDGYDFDSYPRMNDHSEAVLPYLPNGYCLNKLAAWDEGVLTPKQRATWERRKSPVPFSLHCIRRLSWLRPCPTLHSGVRQFIHPEQHRPLTVGEAAALMGWEGDYPRGNEPYLQIVKGIVPSIGEWLAKQVVYSARGDWGKDDWESTYDNYEGEWVGRDTTGQLEKTCDLTKYVGGNFDRTRYPEELQAQARMYVERLKSQQEEQGSIQYS